MQQNRKALYVCYFYTSRAYGFVHQLKIVFLVMENTFRSGLDGVMILWLVLSQTEIRGVIIIFRVISAYCTFIF
jgi:hypothetical protein